MNNLSNSYMFETPIGVYYIFDDKEELVMIADNFESAEDLIQKYSNYIFDKYKKLIRRSDFNVRALTSNQAVLIDISGVNKYV